MRKLPLWALRPGMEVARRVYDGNGFLLLNTGVKLRQAYIERLKAHCIFDVYIVDDLIPDVQIVDVILDQTRRRATHLIRKIIRKTQFTLRKGRKEQLFFPRKDLQDVLEDIICQLLDNRHLAINMTDIRSADGYTFSHSVNVAVLAIVTAAAMELPRSDLYQIGLGALLHDLGKIKVPPAILNKSTPLQSEEMEQIRQHPVDGYRMLQTQNLSRSAALVVYQHHERVDGSGYPGGITGEEIEPFSRIVAVTDVYDALVSDRPYRPAFPPHRALEIIQTGNGSFDRKVVERFCHHIPAFPVGTAVALSDDLIGVVVHNTIGFPTSPRVRVFGRLEAKVFEPVVPFEVNLADTPSLAVTKVFADRELPYLLSGRNSRPAVRDEGGSGVPALRAGNGKADRKKSPTA